jgi:hypothetical protein
VAKEVRGNPTGEVTLLHNPHQEAFWAALDLKTPTGRHAFHRLTLFAGRRGGKTKAGAIAAGKKMQVPRSWGWICAPTYPDLHDFVIPEIFSTIPHAWIGNWSEQHYELELKNYAKCQFRSLEDPDKARGPGLDWAWIDETRKVAELAWKTMLPALTDKGGQAWFTTSPNGYDWCYDTFWVPAKTGVPGYWAVKYKTADNPVFQTPDGRQEIEDARRSMDPLFFQQEFEADFVTFTGAIFGATVNGCLLRSFEEIQAVIPEWPQIDPERAAYVGLDPGADHPFAGLLAVMCDRGAVIIGEYLERNKPIGEHVNGLHRLLAIDNPARPFHPLCWAIDKTQKQFAIELAQHRIYATGAENSVENGIRRVQSWIHTGQLFILADRCPHLVEQLRGYRWAENTKPDGQALREKVIKRHDDLPDALRYLLMAGPTLPEPVIQPSLGLRNTRNMPEDMRWQVERMQKIERIRQDRLTGEGDSTFFASEDDETGLTSIDTISDDPDHPSALFWA